MPANNQGFGQCSIGVSFWPGNEKRCQDCDKLSKEILYGLSRRYVYNQLCTHNILSIHRNLADKHDVILGGCYNSPRFISRLIWTCRFQKAKHTQSSLETPSKARSNILRLCSLQGLLVAKKCRPRKKMIDKHNSSPCGRAVDVFE